MSAVDQLYEKQVKLLPVADRLQLMRLIMDELADSAPRWVVETSDAWSQEDLEDASRAALLHVSRILEGDEEDEDVSPGRSGNNRASAFRSFFVTLPATAVRLIGHCSERDWKAIQICLTRTIATQ